MPSRDGAVPSNELNLSVDELTASQMKLKIPSQSLLFDLIGHELQLLLDLYVRCSSVSRLFEDEY